MNESYIAKVSYIAEANWLDCCKIETDKTKKPLRLIWIGKNGEIVGYSPWESLFENARKDLLKELDEIIVIGTAAKKK